MATRSSHQTATFKQPNLTTSNSRLTLTLSPPVSPSLHSFTPGTTLYPRLTIHSSATSYTSLTLTLIGCTEALIMGKDRWQAGAMANLGSGGSPMLITSPEVYKFLEVNVPLFDAVGTDKKGKGEKEEGIGGGTYEVVLPALREGSLLPTFEKQQDDPAGAGVRYYFELRGVRKGLFHSNDKLTLDIPVSMPLSHPHGNHINPADWPRAEGSKELKYQGSGTSGGQVPHLQAVISYHPLSHSSQPLLFSISLSTTNSSPLVLSPTIQVSLAKRTRTTPVSDPELGKEFQWAGIRMCKGNIEQVGEVGGKVWTGRIEVPRGLRTVMSAGLEVTYTLTVQVTSEAMEHPLVVKIPVFLPSCEEQVVQEYSEDAEGRGGSSGLPSYSM